MADVTRHEAARKSLAVNLLVIISFYICFVVKLSCSCCLGFLIYTSGRLSKRRTGELVVITRRLGANLPHFHPPHVEAFLGNSSGAINNRPESSLIFLFSVHISPLFL
jgi:hypothetical protein